MKIRNRLNSKLDISSQSGDQTCSRSLSKAEERHKIAVAKIDAEERLIALSESGSSVAVSSKVGPIGTSINLMGRSSDFRAAFCTDSKPHLKKMHLGNCAGENSSSLLEGSEKSQKYYRLPAGKLRIFPGYTQTRKNCLQIDCSQL